MSNNGDEPKLTWEQIYPDVMCNIVIQEIEDELFALEHMNKRIRIRRIRIRIFYLFNYTQYKVKSINAIYNHGTSYHKIFII